MAKKSKTKAYAHRKPYDNNREVTFRQYRVLAGKVDVLTRRFEALLSQCQRAGIVH